MEITYLGHSSFRIKTKTATIITDPYSSEMVGLRYPKVEGDIVTVSHQHEDHNKVSNVSGEPFIISLPGEYEVKGVSIFGFASFHDGEEGVKRGTNNIFLIEAEGLRVCHLGDLGALPSSEVLEEIIGVDVLMIPVGGVSTIGPTEADEVISKLEPLIVLPMHYKEQGINEKVFGDLASVDKFLSEMGAEQAEKLDKLSVTKDKLPEETRVVVLQRKA
ncbi:lactamase [Candidatus Microgenomates bacterium]|jgi:L-ascorbate metabolism protein UlaG (beta-lactamase superfamily)|nr:MAG: lactamase [Candidatus Microgenomates bacterium]